jgi:hypothetical protein
MAVGEVVTLINRTNRELSVRFDGRTRILKPGPNLITAEWVRFAKMQNPRMGSFVPGTLQGDYLVGVEGIDEVSMIDMGAESQRRTIEMYDRGGEADRGNTITDRGTGERPPQRMNVGEFVGKAIGESEAQFNGER